MEITEAFGKAVNLSFKGMKYSLNFLKLSERKLSQLIKRKKFLVKGKDFDIVIDYKPIFRQIVLYLTPKKWAKELLKRLDPDSAEFKSMVILLGKIKLSRKEFEVRLGAFGVPSSDLIKATINQKVK